MNVDRKILRTGFVVRACHWAVAFCFFVVAMSGVAWLFPSLSWLDGVFGTPQLARVLHPFFGIAIFLLLAIMFVRLARHNIPRRSDLVWAANIKGVLRNRHDEPLRIGKYNLGQKLLFWAIMILICVLLVTGLAIWRAYFADYFSIPIQRLVLLLHSLAGIALMLLIIGHIYLGIWVKGSISGMITGYVSRSWAKAHHDRWYGEIVNEERRKTLQVEDLK